MERRYTLQELRMVIPESELRFETFRASAPGGQNVQKTESAVRLRWTPETANSLSQEEKQLLVLRLRNEKEMQRKLRARDTRLDYEFTHDGELLISSQDTRDQLQNKEHSKEKFYLLVEEALRPEPKRIPPRMGFPRERLAEKKRRKEKLEQRRVPPREEWK